MKFVRKLEGKQVEPTTEKIASVLEATFFLRSVL